MIHRRHTLTKFDVQTTKTHSINLHLQTHSSDKFLGCAEPHADGFYPGPRQDES